jgi:hypothetical protein
MTRKAKEILRTGRWLNIAWGIGELDEDFENRRANQRTKKRRGRRRTPTSEASGKRRQH